MKIGIYGGSFDPPHKGHRLLAENLAEYCGADKVLIIPTAVSPFKSSVSASSEERLEMCRLNFDSSLYTVLDIEISRGGKSYTIDTVRQIKEMYPDDELYLFMGEDMLLFFDRWYRYKDILSLCTIVCGCRTRDRARLDEMRAFAEKSLSEYNENVLICNAQPFEVSSTDIRTSVDKAEELLQKDVYRFIKSRGLYDEQK